MDEVIAGETTSLTPQRDRAGQLADELMRQTAFARYQQTRAPETIRRQKADLALWITFLTELEYPHAPNWIGCSTPLLVARLTCYWLQIAATMHDPQSWQGITHGLVELYKQWQLQHGYKITSVNVRLATVRKYVTLAVDAGVIPREELALLKDRVKTIQHKEGIHLDQHRAVTSRGNKKAAPVVLTSAQVERLLTQHPNTPQGTRDVFLLALLFRYGLRCGEVSGLTLANYKRATGKLTFYREKTDDYTTLELEPEDRARAERYYLRCQPENEAINPTQCLIMGSNNRKEVFGTMSERAITGRVNTLGKRILGIENLSGHDGRHHSATEYVAGGTDAKTLMSIFSWKNTQTAFNYINAAQVANQHARRGKVE